MTANTVLPPTRRIPHARNARHGGYAATQPLNATKKKSIEARIKQNRIIKALILRG